MSFRLFIGFILASSSLGKAAKPKVHLMVVDGLNDWVVFLGGHPQASAPNIDRFAERDEKKK